MPKYNVLYLPSAQADINDAIRYIAIELANPVAAENLLDTLDEKVEKLKAGFWKGQDLKSHSSGLFKDIDMYWCAVKNYYLFYRFDETNKCIRIFHFAHRLRGLELFLKSIEE